MLVYRLLQGSLEVVFFSSQLVDLVFHLGLYLALLLRLQPLLLPIQLHLLEFVLKTAALDRQFLLVFICTLKHFFLLALVLGMLVDLDLLQPESILQLGKLFDPGQVFILLPFNSV